MKLVSVLILGCLAVTDENVLRRLDKLENMQKVLISTVRYQRGQIQHFEDKVVLLEQVRLITNLQKLLVFINN
jgi:hypothetical protein